MIFDGGSGRRPSAEARRYVYGVLAQILDNELGPDEKEGWIFGGVEDELDRRRLTKAVKAVQKEMRRKAER